ncbi:hypothetical protein F2Q69_00062579 [Brassica cretica]|uniref:Uncharacterized protein n=1 Tax=Brassica cretica TaxID=69181 RepID=A0A8S9RLG8_BRACR|nr:hypothetical protein F2Q69_00062579 [Brassica cretica]
MRLRARGVGSVDRDDGIALPKDEESGPGGSCIDGVTRDDWGLLARPYSLKLKPLCYVRLGEHFIF